MTKILNLDKLSAKETRELRLGGKTYKVKEMSVEDFIETTRMAEKLEGETSFAVQMEATIELIQRSVPEVSTEELKNLTIDQLRAVTAFIRGEDPEKIAAAEAKEDGEKK